MNQVFLSREKESINYLNKNKRLPRPWEVYFESGGDMRLWIDAICGLQKYKNYSEEILKCLDSLSIKQLSDKQKEIEFIKYIEIYNIIPEYGVAYFSDNSDMNEWYISYIKYNKSFESQIYNMLPEYQEFDLAEVWSNIKDEFIYIIHTLKRIPNTGERKVSMGIDVRVIFNKLQTLFPEIAEDLIYDVINKSKKGLPIEEKKKQYLNFVSINEYRPDLQEYRFSDGIDMFTWYTKIEQFYPEFVEQVNELDMNYMIEESNDNKMK